ncbi:single-stranded-DNA-specific exonuclease RecJ [Candidatus Pelagibacter bacterium]|jgi:single-stranded-DNA-specific exonuclease|nr:single-stranded-DNA-specific exonuclease RecJ [Candidatus Pelagibacter bacterium]MDA8772792.1 single-stranded-DNA-specific exonuclease RecJ [Candidatus Pelagibacter bacterium]
MNTLSISGKNWILKKYNQEEISFLKDNFFLDEITSKLLSIRKIKKEDIKSFLNPSIKNFLPNPNTLMDMEKATLRTSKSINKKEKVGIFGDYDVDGATSTALLGKYFTELKIPYEIYIPDRKKEGYGPSIKSFKELIDKGVKIIFTVDCGTLSFDAIEFANENNTDVIVLDHHQSEIKLPKAFSIINPNRFDDESNLQYLCAAGVTFMFLVSINRKLRLENWFTKNNIDEPNLINYLDLVSLGTVCDVVPLIGLNRAIVKQGLKILKIKNNLGLKTLLDICKIESNPSIYHLGFMLGPRINAGGRVGKCSHGANLLLDTDPKNAFKLASELDQFNKERQMLEKDLLQKLLNETKDYSKDPVLVLSGSNWHEGIIGIVAARLKDKFNKPVIIISIDGEIGKASARSIVGFDIGSVIIAATQNKILLKGGGHKMAGGFSINIKNIEKFKEFVFRRFRNINEDLTSEKPLYLDSTISPAAVNLDFYNKVNNLAPFGSGNPEPKFIIENLKTVNSKIVGEKHIKSVLIGMDGSSIKTIAFNAVENDLGAYLLKNNNKIFNIAGKLSLNEWKGQSNVEFIIDDISVNKTLKNTVPSSIG